MSNQNPFDDNPNSPQTPFSPFSPLSRTGTGTSFLQPPDSIYGGSNTSRTALLAGGSRSSLFNVSLDDGQPPITTGVWAKLAKDWSDIPAHLRPYQYSGMPKGEGTDFRNMVPSRLVPQVEEAEELPQGTWARIRASFGGPKPGDMEAGNLGHQLEDLSINSIDGELEASYRFWVRQKEYKGDPGKLAIAIKARDELKAKPENQQTAAEWGRVDRLFVEGGLELNRYAMDDATGKAGNWYALEGIPASVVTTLIPGAFGLPGAGLLPRAIIGVTINLGMSIYADGWAGAHLKGFCSSYTELNRHGGVAVRSTPANRDLDELTRQFSEQGERLGKICDRLHTLNQVKHAIENPIEGQQVDMTLEEVNAQMNAEMKAGYELMKAMDAKWVGAEQKKVEIQLETQLENLNTLLGLEQDPGKQETIKAQIKKAEAYKQSFSTGVFWTGVNKGLRGTLTASSSVVAAATGNAYLKFGLDVAANAVQWALSVPAGSRDELNKNREVRINEWKNGDFTDPQAAVKRITDYTSPKVKGHITAMTHQIRMKQAEIEAMTGLSREESERAKKLSGKHTLTTFFGAPPEVWERAEAGLDDFRRRFAGQFTDDGFKIWADAEGALRRPLDRLAKQLLADLEKRAKGSMSPNMWELHRRLNNIAPQDRTPAQQAELADLTNKAGKSLKPEEWKQLEILRKAKVWTQKQEDMAPERNGLAGQLARYNRELDGDWAERHIQLIREKAHLRDKLPDHRQEELDTLEASITTALRNKKESDGQKPRDELKQGYSDLTWQLATGLKKDQYEEWVRIIDKKKPIEELSPSMRTSLDARLKGKPVAELHAMALGKLTDELAELEHNKHCLESNNWPGLKGEGREDHINLLKGDPACLKKIAWRIRASKSINPAEIDSQIAQKVGGGNWALIVGGKAFQQIASGVEKVAKAVNPHLKLPLPVAVGLNAFYAAAGWMASFGGGPASYGKGIHREEIAQLMKNEEDIPFKRRLVPLIFKEMARPGIATYDYLTESYRQSQAEGAVRNMQSLMGRIATQENLEIKFTRDAHEEFDVAMDMPDKSQSVDVGRSLGASSSIPPRPRPKGMHKRNQSSISQMRADAIAHHDLDRDSSRTSHFSVNTMFMEEAYGEIGLGRNATETIQRGVLNNVHPNVIERMYENQIVDLNSNPLDEDIHGGGLNGAHVVSMKQNVDTQQITHVYLQAATQQHEANRQLLVFRPSADQQEAMRSAEVGRRLPSELQAQIRGNKGKTVVRGEQQGGGRGGRGGRGGAPKTE